MDKKARESALETAKHFTIGYVQWVDAVADAGWEENSKAEVHPVLSIGFIVDETDDAICLAAALSHEQSNSRIHIPKEWIKSMKRVKLDKFLGLRRKPSKPKVQKQKEESYNSGSEMPFVRNFHYQGKM